MEDSGSASTSGDSMLGPRRIPLPGMQEMMGCMVGARFFSTMDLKSGFWQVKMTEKS